ncbi:hypothetical protein Tco_0804259 [Tanacetum coccineum]|uniref:Uncharacterized protein n=1 Tax=Tanacetum coccineum TaxID=301880 RepID=A0ABQ5A6N7_9ASTR
MLEEEKTHRRGKVYNWETATYGKIWEDEDVHDLISVETEFPAIVLNDVLTSKVTLSCKPTVSPFNDNKIDFRISFNESDDEEYTVIYDKNSFSYKIVPVNNLKTDSKNDNDKVNMPSFPSPEPTVSYFDDLDYFKDFEKEFPAIVYNDALTSKLDFLTEPILSPQHIDKFNLKDETSLSKCDEEEQNIFYDLFPFNVIYPNDSKSDKDNDDDKVDTEHSLRGLSVKPLPNVTNNDDGAYAQRLSIRRIETPWIRRIDYLDIIQSLFSSTVYTAYTLNEYSIYDTNINTAYPGVWIWRIDFLYSLDSYSEDQYAVSIKEDTTYLCMHSPKTTKERRSIRRIQKMSIRLIEDIICEYSGRYQTWSLLQETPIRRVKDKILNALKVMASKVENAPAELPACLGPTNRKE